MNLITAFERAFKRKRERGWKHIYVFIDIHDTVFKSDYGTGKNFDYYVNAKKTLQILSNRRDVVLGLLTSSFPADIAKYLEVFEDNDINFQMINENHMEKNTEYACFDKKPYFNVLIEDKAGFEAEGDWWPIRQYLQNNPIR